MPSIIFYSTQPILTLGFSHTMKDAEDVSLLQTCANPAEFLEALSQSPPDVVLLDLTPDFTIDFLTSVHKTANRSKLVLWVHFISTEMALQAMGLGVRGIISKTLKPDAL